MVRRWTALPLVVVTGLSTLVNDPSNARPSNPSLYASTLPPTTNCGRNSALTPLEPLVTSLTVMLAPCPMWVFPK